MFRDGYKKSEERFCVLRWLFLWICVPTVCISLCMTNRVISQSDKMKHVKCILCLMEHHTTEKYGGSGGCEPRCLIKVSDQIHVPAALTS
jgi:hypothetical protein